MPKITKAQKLLSCGLNKKYLESRLSNGANSIDLLRIQLSTDLKIDVSETTVKDLLKLFSLTTKNFKTIDVVKIYTKFDSGKFYEITNEERSKIKLAHNLYMNDASVSLNELAKMSSEIIGMSFDRKNILALLQYLKLPKRTAEMVKKSRVEKANAKVEDYKQTLQIRRNLDLLDSSYTADRLIQEYNEGVSLVALARRANMSTYDIQLILKKSGTTLRKIKEWSDIREDLLSIGVDKSELNDLLNLQNMPQKKMIVTLSEKLNYTLTEKQLTKVLRSYDLKKTPENIKALQGAKSKDEYLDSMARLKKAGFDSPLALAQHYENDKTITRQALIKAMNSKLASEDLQFTDRWLERHMVPHLSEDRLKGISRVELEFIEEVKKIYAGELVLNSRKLIAPYELDIYIPALNIALEFNGDYWHSDKFLLVNHKMTAEEYHLKKFNSCKELGIDLFFIWESDWYKDSDHVMDEVAKVISGDKSSVFLRKIVSAADALAVAV